MVKGEDSLGRGARIRVWDVDVKTQPRETRHASSCCGGRRGRGHLVEVTISPGCVFCLGAQLAGTDSLHAFRPPRRRIRRGRCTIRRGFSLHRRSIHHIWRRTQVEVVELAQLLCSRSFGNVHDGDVVGRWGGRARGGHCRLRFDGPPLHLGVIQSRTRCRWLCLDTRPVLLSGRMRLDCRELRSRSTTKPNIRPEGSPDTRTAGTWDDRGQRSPGVHTGPDRSWKGRGHDIHGGRLRPEEGSDPGRALG